MRLPLLSIVVTMMLGTAADGATPANVRAAFKRPDTIPFPTSNPYNPDKAALGKSLYFDPRVSAAQNMSCATCHNPSFGWEAPLARAVGAMNVPLGRHAPTVLDHAWSGELFWDGRAPNLEEQAKGPIQADVEMNMPLDKLLTRLGSIQGYRNWFARVFPGKGISADTIAAAIATYERTVVSTVSPFDRWVDGDEDAIGASAKRGFELFVGKARCAECHTGWRFTDNLYHDIGMPDADIGRGKLEPGNPLAQHAFRTPSMRDIALRAPFMHDGSIPDLAAVVRHYASGGVARPSRSPLLQPVPLGEPEIADLVAFMEALTGSVADVALPVLPR